MKPSEIRRKNKIELNTTLHNLRKKLRELKFKAKSNKLKNIREIREIKKDIARVLTILKESQIHFRSINKNKK